MDNFMVDITGLDKAEVLKALYTHSHPQGLSFIGLPSHPLTMKDYKKAITENTSSSGKIYFDYWMGHVLKVRIDQDFFDPASYDRDCGYGAAQNAIDELRRMKGE